MISDDDDEGRSYENLRKLGLLHLLGKPEELLKELDRRIAERKKLEEDYEKERLAIRARHEAQLEEEARRAMPMPEELPPVELREPEPRRPRTKSSTLAVLTKKPGTCLTCRHSNQGTLDFSEGLAFCWIAKSTKRPTQTCDVTQILPRHPGTDLKTWETYAFYQPYDGTNGTYEKSEDLRLLADDADEDMKRTQQADIAVIPGCDL
jgi:hypothetical protein